jgi:hypothetical protein
MERKTSIMIAVSILGEEEVVPVGRRVKGIAVPPPGSEEKPGDWGLLTDQRSRIGRSGQASNGENFNRSPVTEPFKGVWRENKKFSNIQRHMTNNV